MPLGVQNVYIFNQGAVHSSFLRTLPVIITAIICDTLLISLAVLGVSVVVLEFYWIKTILFLVGIFFLIFMGFVTWKSKPKALNKQQSIAYDSKKQILFALSVSLLNPHAILDTVGVLGTSSLKYDGIEKIVFTIVCILVSWIWFISLGIAGKIAGKMDKSGRFIIILNKFSACVMWGTAIYISYSFI
nr:LysE family transporter [Chengkuizengella sediminis]